MFINSRPFLADIFIPEDNYSFIKALNEDIMTHCAKSTQKLGIYYIIYKAAMFSFDVDFILTIVELNTIVLDLRETYRSI